MRLPGGCVGRREAPTNPSRVFSRGKPVREASSDGDGGLAFREAGAREEGVALTIRKKSASPFYFGNTGGGTGLKPRSEERLQPDSRSERRRDARRAMHSFHIPHRLPSLLCNRSSSAESACSGAILARIRTIKKQSRPDSGLGFNHFSGKI